MEVMFDNELISVNIIRKDNKNLYFRFSDDLTLTITCNKRISEKDILKLIEENIKPLTKMYQKAKKKSEFNANFHYLGDTYTIVVDPNISEVTIDGSFIFTPNKKALDKFLNNETNRIFTNRSLIWKEVMDFVPDFKLKIRKMRTRWGVCNKTNRIITLNSELIKRDLGIIDYVIIHELCHFKYPNHQKEYWDLVGCYYPNYKRARKILKEG